MRAVAITIGCGLAMSGGMLIALAAQNPAQNPPVQAPPTNAPPAQAAPPPPVFERQWNHNIDAAGQVSIAAGPQRVFVSDDEAGVEARAGNDGALAWQAALPTDLPVAISGDQVFVSSGRQLHALEEATGQPRWARPLDAAAVALIAQPGGGALIAGARTVRAWSADGMLRWERPLAAEVGRELLAADASQVYVALTDMTMVAIDLKSGIVRWIEKLGTLPIALTLADGKIYFGGTDRHLHAYKQDGGHDWTYHRQYVVGAPVVDEDYVYVALRDNTVVAHAKGGTLKWRRPLDDSPARGPMLSGPYVATVLSSDVIATMPRTPDKAAAGRGASGKPDAPAPPRSSNRVLVATLSTDATQVFAVIQLETQVRIVAAYKRGQTAVKPPV